MRQCFLDFAHDDAFIGLVEHANTVPTLLLSSLYTTMLGAQRAKPFARSFTSRAVDGFTGAIGNTPLVGAMDGLKYYVVFMDVHFRRRSGSRSSQTRRDVTLSARPSSKIRVAA